MELYLRMNRTLPEDYFATAMFFVTDEAGSFAYDLIHRNRGEILSWPEFKVVMRKRYEKPAICSELLYQKLDNIRFDSTPQRAEFCTKFRSIEQQIFNMSFDNRLCAFLQPLPMKCRLHIKLNAARTKDIEECYQVAREWA